MITTVESLVAENCPCVVLPQNGLTSWTKMHGLIAAVTFFLEICLSGRILMGFPGPVRYYAQQWTTSYANGFSRRGLLGEAIRLCHMDNGDCRLITMLGWVITIALFMFFVKALAQALSSLEQTTRYVLFTVILLSPLTTGMLVATTGDPMQLVLLLYIGTSAIFLKPEGNLFAAAIAFVCLGAVCSLIHEASMFFIGPFLLLSAFVQRRSTLHKAAFAAFVVGVVPVLLFTVHATESHASASISAMHLGHEPMMPASSEYHPDSFSNLLKIENDSHFHSGISGYAITLRNLVGALSLPAFFIFVLSRVIPTQRWVIAFCVPLALSTPLWVIAHDWGRFSSFLFILMIVSLARVDYHLHTVVQQCVCVPVRFSGRDCFS